MDGYGRILDVDLTQREVLKKDVDCNLARKYLGGVGFSLKILYDEVGPDVDPLSPENIVIFANGPLTGTRAPCGGRTEITTKHPLTGNIGVGNTGGTWGAALKHAGFDMVIIRGRTNTPVYLLINDDHIEIRDASHLWGKETRPASDIIRQELSPQASVLTIGPAGENLVKYACPVNDYYHVAGRCGAGGVMGAKNLKAIAVMGSRAPRPARPGEFQEAVRAARERLLNAAGPWATFNETGGKIGGQITPRHYQVVEIPNWDETRSMSAAMKYAIKKRITCYSCAMKCLNQMGKVKEGKYAGVEEVLRPSSASFFGALCDIDNLPAILKCRERCQQLGMDMFSAAGTIAFAMELFQRGVITVSDTDGLELGWGNDDAIVEMLHKIAFRDGFGNILAEGSLRAAKKIGRGAEKYEVTVKGMEGTGDPRTGRKGWMIGQITNPRGDVTSSTHYTADFYNPNWWLDKFDMPEDVKHKIYTMPPEEVTSTWEGKAIMCKWFEDLHAVADCLGLCFFPSHMRLSWGPTYFSKLFSSYTGLDTTPDEIMAAGERVFNLFKAYSVRQGLSRKDDDWPDRFYEETLDDGSATGASLSRTTIDHVLDDYYDLRGWNKVSGIPSREKLIELGLGEVADELSKMGKLT
jgi:aldehyde:ferredoxin oxidoreductase